MEAVLALLFYTMHIAIAGAIVGVSTYGLSSMIVFEDGPFRAVKRLKWGLLPEHGKPSWLVLDSPEPAEQVPRRVVEGTKMKAETDTWESSWAVDSWFAQTPRGMLYLLLSCVFCLGLWVSLGIAFLGLLADLVPAKAMLPIWFLGYGVHSYLSK